MKKYKYIIIALISLAFNGCEDLDREFVTTLQRDEIDASFENVSSLLNSIYSELPDGLTPIGGAAMMASASDEAEFSIPTNSVQNFNTGGWNAVSNPESFVWGNYYRGIRKINQFLVSTDKINLDRWKLDPSSQIIYEQNLAAIARWKYEARFLRAYFYFELVKRYGGVPLLNTELSLNDDFTSYKRNTLEECINFITSECTIAAQNLPLNTSTLPYANLNDLGRVTKLSALALKSRVLLYAASDLFNTPSWAAGYPNPELISLPSGNRNDRWKAASDAAKAVIDAGTLPVLGAYKALFNTNNNAEIILARTSGRSNAFEKINAPIGFNTATGGNAPSQDLVDAYEVRVGSGASATAVMFNWNDPAMAANPYANRDPRLDFSIVVNKSNFGTPARPVQLWEGGLDGKPIINASRTGYYLRKYQFESFNLTNNADGIKSWILFRFPEIYLNYAEALNEWSPGNADIKIYYDRVRSRTGVAMPGLPAGLSPAQVRERIRNEKRVEFAFEDHRLWDVRRWMQGPEFLGKPLRGVKVISTNPINTTFSYTPVIVENRTFDAKMYLYPIPQSDLNISKGGLIQNPLW
ncbi:RagB/SusD family nutrient uptake outer membrane protein [Flavobacterium circumlabens]|uniref:Outer membrane starch-binding protein n=1 Tax=Flavobacterium circumlabens TaxID=2133765 RepID=A0A4Y7UDB3_9FLAO|nr:RagB/SusD family nutrient uptake outer membrane protein [Flavobacterium circumlabens]TCN59044.1 putative outer membrane starch-binding protein [Flavobacterium circumlabens]TEB44440.1 RagB/SusD family nutrient uptake outer membrane protein [Flavobacterium circumlabens]